MNQVSYATNLKHNSSNSGKLTNHCQPCKTSIDLISYPKKLLKMIFFMYITKLNKMSNK